MDKEGTHEETAHGHGGHHRRGRLGRCGDSSAQTQEDTDFSGGRTRGRDAPRDDLALSPTSISRRSSSGTALPTGWETVPWAPGGSATVAGGIADRQRRAGEHDVALRLRSLARLRGHVLGGRVPARRLRRDFNDPPWAMFSTGGGALPVGLYARTLAPGGTAQNTLHRRLDPLEEHDYSIEWTPTEVRYFVDGALVARMRSRSLRRCDRSPATSIRAAVSVRVDYLDLLLVSDRGHLHVSRLRRRRQPRHLADAERGVRYARRYRRDVRGPHREHPDAGCFLDRLAAGRARRRGPGARSGGAISSTA